MESSASSLQSAGLSPHPVRTCESSPAHRSVQGEGKVQLTEVTMQSRAELSMTLSHPVRGHMCRRKHWATLGPQASAALTVQGYELDLNDNTRTPRNQSPIVGIHYTTGPASCGPRRGDLAELPASAPGVGHWSVLGHLAEEGPRRSCCSCPR